MNNFIYTKIIIFFVLVIISYNIISMSESEQLQQIIETEIYTGDISLKNIVQQELGQNQSFKLKAKRTCSVFCDTAFKVLVLAFIVTTGVVMYKMVSELFIGCNEMHDACDTCKDDLETVGKVAKEIIQVLKHCPKGQQDAMDAVNKIIQDCCNQSYLS